MHRDKEKRIILMGDNDEKRQLFETCNIKGKMTVSVHTRPLAVIRRRERGT